MFDGLPKKAREIMDWEWAQFEPYYQDLVARELTEANVHQFLADWSHLDDLLSERGARLYINTTLDTTSEDYKNAYTSFMEQFGPPSAEFSNQLKKKLLESGIEPEGFEVPLRNMRAEADLYREENVPLAIEHEKLSMAYYEIIGTETVEWEGQELTPSQLVPLVKDADRPTREKAWRLVSERVLEDREKVNENWKKLIEVRRQIAKNAGKQDYREYVWQEKLRFDYTPADAEMFQRAIEEVVVPAAARVYERRRQRWGVDTLRPWDVGVDAMRNTDFTGDPLGRAPIKPFKDVKELEEKAQEVFNKVDPVVGEYFTIMRRENLMDLPNYKGKGPGAYCHKFPTEKRPFVFMNVVGSSQDVDVLLHECGHAFHGFEINKQPYTQLRDYPMEFAEVASMAMELLGAPYLKASEGGFYTDAEASRAMVEHLEQMLVFWPYMAVVDAFNHWANVAPEGDDPAACDAKWGELWDRFIVGVDWSGLEDEKVTGWHRKLHIHTVPFYYIEYGLAQLGATLVWRNALKDQAGAVRDYLNALALGGSKPLPELYKTAGVNFAFDAATLREAVDLLESTIDRLEGQVEAV